MENLRTLIQNITKDPNWKSLICKVVSVDKVCRTCTVEPAYSEGSELINVRLQAALNATNGVVIIPLAGSLVVVLKTDDGRAFIVATTEFEEVVFNGGTLGGLININYLLERLNAIEDKINEFRQTYNSHVHADPVSGNVAATVQRQNSGAGKTNLSDLEDDKIRH